jgi:hypothetical protein
MSAVMKKSRAKRHKVHHNVATNYTKYPFYEMEVGDSFIVPDGKIAACRSRASKVKIDYGWAYSFTYTEQLQQWVCRREV